MRFVALAVILLSLPAFIHWLTDRPDRRQYAMMFLGIGFFLAGVVQIEASFITWPLWSGTVKGVTVSFTDMMALALIITRRRSGASLPMLWVLLVYLGTAALSMLPSRLPMASFFYVFQVLRCILLFAAITPEMTSFAALRGLLRGLSLGLLVQFAFVVQQKLSGTVQAHGTMIHQNTLGIMTELVIIPLVAALLAGVKDRLLMIGVACGLVIVAAGGSRATLAFTVASVGILLVLSIIQHSTPTKMKMAGLAVLLGVLVAPISLATLNARFGSSAVVQEDQSRIAMERAATAMSSDNPFGVGANMYVSVANSEGYSVRGGVSWGGNLRAVPVHNAFLLARSETGWLGQFAFLLLFAVPAFVGFRYAFRSRKTLDGSMALGTAIALTAVAIHSQYEFVVQATGPQGLLFIDIALIAGAVRAGAVARARAVRAKRVAQQSIGNDASAQSFPTI